MNNGLLKGVRQVGVLPISDLSRTAIPGFAETLNFFTLGRAVIFFGAHIPLALAMQSNSLVATAHALLTLAVGLWLAAKPFTNGERVAYVGAYIAGAEVLWRMTEAQVFWEFGKYAAATVFIIAIIRSGKFKPPSLMLFYFALLLPSAAITVLNHEWPETRQLLSDSLSGPFALAVCAHFFSSVRLNKKQSLQLLMVPIGPLAGVAAVTIYSTYAGGGIYFTDESNFATSGGFGPNQVSSALGLGVLLSFLLAFMDRSNVKLKILFFAMVIIFGVQSAMTFSRGGLYNSIGAAALAGFYLVRSARASITLLIAGMCLILVVNFFVLPRLDEFTGGALSERFGGLELTHRGEIAQWDLEIWASNPVFGVGPGESKQYREQLGFKVAAHTEFTRMLAEHGTLGLIAIPLLFIAILRNLLRARSNEQKAVSAAALGWSFLYMMNAAMRLVAPSLMLGLTFASLFREAAPNRPGAKRQKNRASATTNAF
jgi:hypothetical protein